MRRGRKGWKGRENIREEEGRDGKDICCLSKLQVRFKARRQGTVYPVLIPRAYRSVAKRGFKGGNCRARSGPAAIEGSMLGCSEHALNTG